MFNDSKVRGVDWRYSEKLIQAFLFRAGSSMMPQQHETQSGASRFAAAAVDQNPHDAGARAPFLNIVQCTFNKFRRLHSRPRLNVVASEDDLPLGPFGPDFAGEP